VHRVRQLHPHLRLGMVNELHPRGELMGAVLRIAEKIASNSPTGKRPVSTA